MSNKNKTTPYTIYSITCNFNFSIDASIYPEPLEGKMLFLDDEGYFEGIPYNHKEKRSKLDKIIFGVYNKDKGIDIYIIDKERYDSAIHLKAFKNNDNLYFGDAADLNFFGENSIGSCELYLSETDIEPAKDFELEMELKYIKNKLRNNDNYKFYIDFYSNKKGFFEELDEECNKQGKKRTLKQAN